MVWRKRVRRWKEGHHKRVSTRLAISARAYRKEASHNNAVVHRTVARGYQDPANCRNPSSKLNQKTGTEKIVSLDHRFSMSYLGQFPPHLCQRDPFLHGRQIIAFSLKLGVMWHMSHFVSFKNFSIVHCHILGAALRYAITTYHESDETHYSLPKETRHAECPLRIENRTQIVVGDKACSVYQSIPLNPTLDCNRETSRYFGLYYYLLDQSEKHLYFLARVLYPRRFSASGQNVL
jgi:hypothetical protein